MNTFVGMLLTEFTPKQCLTKFSVLDSMPIVTCSGKRSGKVAPEIQTKVTALQRACIITE